MSQKWKTIRCIVEVKVPPKSRITTKDLIYQTKLALGRTFLYTTDVMPLPREREEADLFTYRVLDAARVRQAEAPPEDHVDSRRGQFEHGVLALLWIIILAVVFKQENAARDRASTTLSGIRAFGDRYGVQGEKAQEYRRERTFWLPNVW